MGCVTSKCRAENETLRARVLALEKEGRDMKLKREQESRAYEHCVSLLATKEVEWRKEGERWKEEVGLLKRKLEKEEERRRAVEAMVTSSAASAKVENGWQQQLGACYLVEQMRVEQAMREEAVEKWKQLYHAIKSELDDLIRTTHQGERLCWGNEDVIDGLQRELKGREETEEALRVQLAATEEERAKRDREVDILRQSLRILSSGKRHSAKQTLPKSLHS